MAGNPQIPQGVINKLRASVSVTDSPELNVTSPFLNASGISLAFDGKATNQLPTTTGIVNSPEPFVMARVTINLLRTQNLAATWKSRLESNTQLGDMTIKADAAQIGTWALQNCSLENVNEMPLNGTDAGYVIQISGIYQINSTLWNLN